jgi:hypothetical protein
MYRPDGAPRPKIAGSVWRWFFAAALSLLLLLDPASAQPKLEFKADTLNLRLKPPGFKVDRGCDRDAGALTRWPQRRPTPDLQTASTTVFLHNTGDTAAEGLNFSARIQARRVGIDALFKPGFYRFYDPETVPVDVYVCSSQSSVEPGTVEPVELWLEAQPIREAGQVESWVSSGYLLVSVEGQEALATLKLNLIDTAPSHKRLANSILGLSLLFMAALGGVLYFRTRWQHRRLGDAEPKVAPDVETEDSWASKTATVGGILGTLLAAGVLSEGTFMLPKEQFVALNVLFVLLVLFAATLNTVFFERTRVLYSVVALGAAFGQVITAIVFLEEIGIQGYMTPLAVRLLQLAALTVLFVVCLAAYGRLPPAREAPSATDPANPSPSRNPEA